MNRSPPAIVCLRCSRPARAPGSTSRSRCSSRRRGCSGSSATRCRCARRSASSISAMSLLAPRLMPRSSSSSAIDAVADDAAVARERRRLVDQRRGRARRACRRGRRARRSGCGRAAPGTSSSTMPHARDRGNRLLERRRDRADRRCRARRGRPDARCRGPLQRVAQLAAIVPRNAKSSTASRRSLNPLQRDERAEQPPPQQPAAHRGDRAIELVQQGSGPPAVGRFEDLEILQGHGSISRQSAPLRKLMSRTCASSAFCVSWRYWTSAPAAGTAAG